MDKSLALMGAICGDIIGSSYEFNSVEKYQFDLFTNTSKFTDDTVMTVAVAQSIMLGGHFDDDLQNWGTKYPNVGYGTQFQQWLDTVWPRPYNSYGSGAAMRVSAAAWVGWYSGSLEVVLGLAKLTAKVSHNHPEGIKGALAVSHAIFLALENCSKDEIKKIISSTYNYNLDRDYNEIRETYVYDNTCQNTVPESIIAFLESNDYESSIRKAVYLGGDADTMGAIAGSIAAAYYGEIPDEIYKNCWLMLPKDMQKVIKNFVKYLEYVKSKR